MRLSKSLTLLAPALLFVAAATAVSVTPNLTGKWTGTIEIKDAASGTTITTSVQAQLRQEASGTVTGTVGREGENEAVTIRNAKLEGNQFSFEAVHGEASGPIKFTLTLAGDQLRGEMKGAVDSDDIVGQVKMDRVKN